MSDYDRCEKHEINYLVPEMIDCPICYLEYLRGLETNSVFAKAEIDSETIDEIIRLVKIGLFTEKGAD